MELASRNPKSIYFLSGCPKILFDELVYTLRTHVGKNVEVVNVFQKTNIYSEFFNYDFFSGRKVLVVDLDALTLSRQQTGDLMSILHRYENAVRSGHNTKMNFLLVRSYLKQGEKDLYKKAREIGVAYWISWKTIDVLSIVKSKFPDVRFPEESEALIADMVNRGLDDIIGILKKAVLYAYPRRYISEKDITSVLETPDISLSTRRSILKLILGDHGEIQHVLSDNDRVQQILPYMVPIAFSIVKLKVESKEKGFLDKFKIVQDLKIRNIDDNDLKRIKALDEVLISKELSDVLYKSRIGYLQSLYVYDFFRRFLS